MGSVSGKIMEDFLAKLGEGTDVRPDQIDKLAKLFSHEKAPKVDDLVSVFSAEPPPDAPAEDGEVE